MGQNNYVRIEPEQVITDDMWNQYFAGLVGNIFPRNGSGIPTAFAGNLGSLAIPFGSLFVNRIVATNLSLTSGDALPANPHIGDRFILLTTNPRQIHTCLTQGVWTQTYP